MPRARCASSSPELPDLPTFRVNREPRSGVWIGVVLDQRRDSCGRHCRYGVVRRADGHECGSLAYSLTVTWGDPGGSRTSGVDLLRGQCSAAARRSIDPTSREPAPADERFSGAVRALPREQMSVVAVHYVEDQFVDAIAALRGCTASTVKPRCSELEGPSRAVWAHRLKRSTVPELMEHESIDDVARRAVAALHREASARSLPELEGNHSVRFDDCTGPSVAAVGIWPTTRHSGAERRAFHGVHSDGLRCCIRRRRSPPA